MKRNNHNYNKSNNTRKSEDDGKKRQPTYDELFPPLSGSSAAPEQEQQQKEAVEEVNPNTSASGKKHRTWKPLSAVSQPMNLPQFVFNSPKTNTASVTKHGYGPNNRSERKMTADEERIDTKLCEIILTIHLRREFVSVERIAQELFKFYGVSSFGELDVDDRNLKTLTNHTHRIKDVTFYMQVFKEIFNLCTLHDLEPLLSKFLKVNKYEDAHLGPLHVNPDVIRVFDYQPRKQDQPIPGLTSGQIISAFLDFQERQQRRLFDYKEFLDELVQKNKLQKREELGIFCRSFKYLSEVTKKVAFECNKHKKKTDSDAQKHIISTVEARLWEIQQEIGDELDVSSYVNKSPMAVFEHLISVVDKHLTVAQQKSVRDALIRIRDDQLLRCLLNISIYLGTIDQPDKFAAEFRKHYQQNSNSQASSSVSSSKSKPIQYVPITNPNVDVVYTTVETSYDSSGPKAEIHTVFLEQLCVDVFKLLARFDTVPTIKQLVDIKKTLCNQHSVKTFAEFGIYDDDCSLDMVTFLHLYREMIDPRKELSIYEHGSSMHDRQEIYSFVNQLTVVNSWREKQEEHQYSNSRDIPFSKDQLSAVEKAIQYKFGGASLTNNRTLQIIKKAKTQYSRQTTHSIIHYEESLLDEVSLNRLSRCPPSLLVDESQLCHVILQCPIMTDLSAWLQWSHFFQSRHGSLKAFIHRKAQEFDRLLLLETSNHELLRLPMDSSPENFEKELQKGNIRSSVGHLCALIITEYVQVNHVPFTIYRQIMHTWFIQLRSMATLQENMIEPMQYVLEFLTYLPSLVGQTRIVQELILEPLDQVFSDDDDDDDEENETINVRQRIWMLADRKQRNQLEMWAYILDVDEWKNENKWKGVQDIEEEQPLQRIEIPKRQIIYENKIVEEPFVPSVKVPTTPTLIVKSPTVEMNVPTMEETDPNYAAFEHIKSIYEGFGIDTEHETERKVINNLQGVLQRGLEKLANDLFSEQGHFVLELIQNADDNQYPSDCLPTLRFVVSSDRILVCNNEIGFQPANVNAICNIGNSTKGKHKQGYTGHKGIGFKSVFMVSHRPEIHSGNYHFCFNTVNGTEKMGYIRPIWLEKFEEILPSIDEWRTCIRLPIRNDKRGDRLKRNFDDIHVKLLLFLNRLRQIEIVRQKTTDEIDSQIFRRIDHAQGKIIELRKQAGETTIQSFWLVETLSISVPDNIKKQLTDVKTDFESTTIAIAYPLDAIHDSSSYEILSSQPIFAYLPLRSFGFHFILQGDFEIPASRQDILRDNVWNEWLKKEMVRLLPLAYESFRKLPNLISLCSADLQKHFGTLTTIDTLKFFIKMIPTRNDIDPYFNSFIDKTIVNLMGIVQLPIIDGEHIQWISPTQCVIVRDAFIKQIFSQELLLSHFNNYYLNEQFINECSESILIKLGCRRLDFSTIIKLIRTLYTQNQQEYSTKTTTIEQIAQWFLCIDYSLQQERERPGFNFDDNEQTETTTMDQLKQMKIIPLKDQTRLVSIEEFNQRTILFPLDKSIKYEKHLKIILEDLPTIDERLIEYIEKKFPRRLESIKHLLRDLGISESRNVQRIYSNHILPIISNDVQWSTKSDSTLIAYLIFIYKELYSAKPEHFASEMEKLKTKLIVKTREGKFTQINSNNILHLPSSYGCKQSLDLLNLSKHRFQFISDDYLNEYRAELFYQDRERFRFLSFLNELNIQDFFLVKRIDNGFINAEQLAGTQWSHLIGALSASVFEPFIIQDYSCEEFDALVTSMDVANSNQYFEILLYLDHYFSSIASYFAAIVIKSRERHLGKTVPVQGIESSFCLSLRKHSWIPIGTGQLFQSTDVYILRADHPFHRYVPCFDQKKCPLKNRDFIQLLGFKQEIVPMTMFELFMKWSCNLDQQTLQQLIDTNQDAVSDTISCTISSKTRQLCSDTIQNIHKIYGFMYSSNDTRTLIRRFRLWPIIFVPRTNDLGEFVYAHETFWQDNESLITNINGYIVLQAYYKNDNFAKQFFTLLLQVRVEPTLDDYLLLLSTLENQTIECIWKFIKVITKLAFVQNKQSFVKEQCKKYSFIPCLTNSNKKLVQYTDQPYFPHDMNIASLFADCIPILNLPNDLMSSYEFKEQFCSLFNIENLSNVIKIVVNVDNPKLAEDLLNFYSHTIEIIQYFLLMNRLLSESRSIYLQTIFAKMSFISVECIHLSYQYKENLIPQPSLNLATYVDESKRTFYILEKCLQADSYRIDAFVNYILFDPSARLKLSQYIKILFKVYLTEGTQELVKQREKLPELKITKWFIPQVIQKEPIIQLPIVEEIKEEEEEESVVVTAEMIEKKKNEPGWELPKRNTQLQTDPNQPKPLVSFPANAGATPSIKSNDIEIQPSSTVVPNKNNSSSSAPTVETTATTTTTTTTTVSSIDEKKNVKQNSTTNEHKSEPNVTPLKLSDFTSTPPQVNFEQIPISNFADLVLSSSSNISVNPPTKNNNNSSEKETDIAIGRHGEEFVYQYLLWKYPKAQIRWINQQAEYGQPFDIEMIRQETGNQRELIEVKTTRIRKQNTFQISVNEVECLLANQNNYYIYRVYYDNDKKSSTITILSQIKCHLQQKQLGLSITMPE